MAAATAWLGRLLLQPFSCGHNSRRLRSKINIKHPKPGPLERRILVEVTKPVYAPTSERAVDVCTRRAALLSAERETSKYEEFLVRFAKAIFEENQSGVIGVFHRMPMNASGSRQLKVHYSKAGFTVRFLSNSVIHKALQDTKWENLLPLFISHNLIIHSPDSSKTKLMFEMARKSPEISLLAAVVHDQILSRADLERYTKLPEKSQLYVELAGILEGAVSEPSQLLQRHQTTLVSLLAARAQPPAKSGGSE